MIKNKLWKCALALILVITTISNKNICYANSTLMDSSETQSNKQVITSIKPLVSESITEDTDELELLALIIYQEHGGNASSDSSRIMVGNVVMNRVNSSRFPNSIYEVITANGQYGQENPKWPQRAKNSVEWEAVVRAFECAQRILDGEVILPDYVVFQANFKQGKGTYIFQDDTYFCY